MSNSYRKILPALIAAITVAFVTESVYGVPDHQLILTENSSTSLSVTYDGTPVPVTFSGTPDVWLPINLPVNLSPSGFNLFWFEPGSSVLTNDLNENVFFAFFSVTSDTLPFLGFSPQPDGFTFVHAGIDNGDLVGVDITFHDLGDIPATPDTGTTGSLFALSLTGLAFLRRKVC